MCESGYIGIKRNSRDRSFVYILLVCMFLLWFSFFCYFAFDETTTTKINVLSQIYYHKFVILRCTHFTMSPKKKKKENPPHDTVTHRKKKKCMQELLCCSFFSLILSLFAYFYSDDDVMRLLMCFFACGWILCMCHHAAGRGLLLGIIIIIRDGGDNLHKCMNM